MCDDELTTDGLWNQHCDSGKLIKFVRLLLPSVAVTLKLDVPRLVRAAASFTPITVFGVKA